jgi:cell division septation protein DedD
MGKKFSRMKTNDIRVIKLMKEGFSFETLRNLNESQINVLYKRIVKEEGTVTVPNDTDASKIAAIAKTGTNVQIADGELGEDAALNKMAGIDPYEDPTPDGNEYGPSNYGVNPEEDKEMNDGMSIESEIKEKAVSKKQQKFMGVEKTKKESYLRNVKMIEESLIKLVQKHITPVMTKKDLMNIVEAGPGTKEAPVKTPTRTKPDKPSWTKPKHVPAPKAKKDDETFTMQLPSFLQFDNLNIEFNDEKKS